MLCSSNVSSKLNHVLQFILYGRGKDIETVLEEC